MNPRLRRVARDRGQFRSGQATLKVLYLAVTTWRNSAVATWESAALGVTIKALGVTI
jgi:hypothetical protein